MICCIVTMLFVTQFKSDERFFKMYIRMYLGPVKIVLRNFDCAQKIIIERHVFANSALLINCYWWLSFSYPILRSRISTWPP